MITQLRFNTHRALQAVVSQPEKYIDAPINVVTAVLVRHWPDTMSSKRHPMRDGDSPENIWPFDPRSVGMSEADIKTIENQFQQECNIMADALRNTHTHQDIFEGFRQSENRLVQAYALNGELYSYPSEHVVVPTIHMLYGRRLTVMMMYSYHELMPLLIQPPAAWPADVVQSLRDQYRLDMTLYAAKLRMQK